MNKTFLISSILIFFSCNQTYIFDEYKDFPEQSWSSDEILKFEYFVEDTAKTYTTVLKLRHTVNYEFQNLFLFIYNENKKDTVEVFLSNKKGEWIGKGIGDIRELELIIDSQKTYANKKKQTILVEHAMRFGAEKEIKKLENIDAVGIIVLSDYE